MKRTQVQIPDWLFLAAQQLSEKKEISLAELVRRGLEYMLAVTPEAEVPAADWVLPEPCDLQSSDPFASEGWREALHMAHSRIVASSTHG